MKDETKSHYYCFTYIGTLIKTGQQVHACTYTGYPIKAVSKPMIEANKANAGVDKNAVLLSVSYLGYMTKKEMTG